MMTTSLPTLRFLGSDLFAYECPKMGQGMKRKAEKDAFSSKSFFKPTPILPQQEAKINGKASNKSLW